MLFGRYSGVDEALVTSVQTATLKASMTKKLDIVVDNTNLNINHREKLTDLATRNGYKVVIKDFDVSVEDCIWRDMFRDKSVGEEVIRRMHKMYLDQR
jgi:predicted kinase